MPLVSRQSLAVVLVVLLVLSQAASALRPLLSTAARNALINDYHGVESAGPTFAVDVYAYGATGDGSTDDTTAFQNALNAVASGGVVYVPAGRYMLNGTLSMPAGTTLQGTFGTVPSHDIGMNPSDPLQGSILLPSGGRGETNPAAAFLTVNEDCTVRGFVVYYPDVTCGPVPIPYPWTFYLTGNNPSVQDVECLNCWNFVNATGAGRHYLARLQGQPINIGVFVDETYDIGRIEDVHFNPWFCQQHTFMAWQLVQGRAFVIARSDWEYVFNTFAFGYAIGYHFIESAAGACNGNFLGIGADMMTNASVQIDAAQPEGILITNGEFTAFCSSQWGLNCSNTNPIEIVVGSGNVGLVRIVNSAFWGPSNNIAFIAGSGTVSFGDCTFLQWDEGNHRRYAIEAGGTGSLLVRGCSFWQSGSNQIQVLGSLATAVIAENSVNGPLLFDVPSKSQYAVALNVAS